ncbi:MAG: leucine-rich repeat protein [Prevotella sp.]|nr:leucine-rich repeat protein [Prevotella sp.]
MNTKVTKTIRQLATGVLRQSVHNRYSLLLLFALMAGQSLYAHDFEVDGIYYGYDTETKTAYVTYANDNSSSALYSGSVSIPPDVTFNGRTLEVKAIGKYAFYKCSGLTSITIPNSVTSIGNMAFGQCKGLKKVTIPDAVKTIGNYAFWECSNLEDVDTGQDLQTIGDKVFEDCSMLKSITFPNGLTTIGASAFSGCKSLTSITLPSSLRNLEGSAFYKCSGLTNVVIENGLTYIPSSGFENCSGLKSIIFPNSIERIGSSAFQGCSGLKRVLFPQNLSVVEDLAFFECPNIKCIVFADGKNISIGYRAFLNSYPDSLYIGRNIDLHGFETGDGYYTTVSSAINLSELKILTFGANVTEGNMKSASKLEKIYSKLTRIFNCSFDSKTCVNAKLYVSPGTKKRYESYSDWKNFWSIEEMEESAMWNGNDESSTIITVTADDKTMVYGDEVPEFTYTVSGGTLDGKPDISTVARSYSDVGTYPISMAMGTITNKWVYLVNGTLTITKAPLTVGVQSVTIYEGDAIPSFTLTYSGFKNNQNESVLTAKPTAITTATSSSPAGTYPITISGGSATNYSFSYVSGTLTILKKEVDNPVVGDVNADGTVGIGDIVAVTNVMAGITTDAATISRADVNGDGSVGIGDIVAITNIMAGIEVYADLALESTAPISLKAGQLTSVNIISGSGSYTATSSNANVVTAVISDWTSVTTQEKGKCVNIKATGVGTAIVTVSDSKSGQNVTISVTVTENVKLLELSTYALDLKVGESGVVAITSSSGGQLAIATTDASVATFAVDGNTITVKAIGAGNCAITVNDSQTGEKARVEVTVTAPAPPAGVKAVDLGLPSGTLWANMNVGATSPQENGLYFAWGDTEGYAGDASDGRSFDWASYKWMTPGQSDSKYINKYQTPDGTTDACWYQFNWDIVDYEFIGDALTELLPGDDAAHANWGGDWYMPTKEDFQELLDNTTFEWITVGAVGGVKFTSKVNGNVIFLPASGLRLGSVLDDTGERGYYWSSTLDGSDSYYSCNMYFYSGGADCRTNGRYRGLTVRPVLHPKQAPDNVEAVDLGLPSGTKWANMNIGASSPEDYGYYFAWGETEPKSTYSWSTYTHCDGSQETCHDIGTNIAGTEYDVATAQWGKSWHMPTLEQINELVINCTSQWTTQNDVKGQKLTSKVNGKAIFLPAAGGRWAGELLGAGSIGFYWSSTLNESGPGRSPGFIFNSYGSSTGSISDCSDGHTVRPVR